jgi:hypothetical protein
MKESMMKHRLTRTALLLTSCVAVHASLGQSLEEKIAAAVLPLPEELRSDATVYEYDAETAERVVLRQGRNHVECQAKDPDSGFTLCFGVADAARRDLAEKLRAEGLSGDELDAELAQAEAQGRVEPAPFGSLQYRL